MMEIGNELVFLKTPELSTEEKVVAGVENHGFKFIANEKEILVINQLQLLIWSKPN
jgi:hypothetical protein